VPFTLSHAAAVLPFRKLKPIWPALVIGTFAPDLQYFIWISDEDHSGHHFPDVFLITLPLALLVLWLFEWIVKGPGIELLPRGVQRRLQNKLEPLSFWGWKRLGSIILWITVGIATHLVWDQFTHPYSRLASHSSLLSTSVQVWFLSPMSLAKFLQHASTILGLLVLCLWFAAWYLRTPPVPSTELRGFSPFVKVAVVFTIMVIAILAGYSLAIFKMSGHEPPFSRSFVLATVFEAVTLVFCIELLLYGAAFTVSAGTRRLSGVNVDLKRETRNSKPAFRSR
jgi:magnesium-transporting ATPase (P-type)